MKFAFSLKKLHADFVGREVLCEPERKCTALKNLSNNFTCTHSRLSRRADLTNIAVILDHFTAKVPGELLHDLVLDQTSHYLLKLKSKAVSIPLWLSSFAMLLFDVNCALAHHFRPAWWRNCVPPGWGRYCVTSQKWEPVLISPYRILLLRIDKEIANGRWS